MSPEKLDVIYDAIVIGAGPAGCIVAWHLAQAGLSVLILEKHSLPRVKPCAGGLTFKARQAIPFDVSPVISVEATGGILTYHGKPFLWVDLEKPLASLVNRDEFDHFLLKQALKAGAKVLENARMLSLSQNDASVIVNSTNGTHNARFLVGADGINSQVAKQLALMPDREIAYAIEAELQVPRKALEELNNKVLFDFGAVRKGYGWIFPKKDHLSVGVCQALTGKTNENSSPVSQCCVPIDCSLCVVIPVLWVVWQQNCIKVAACWWAMPPTWRMRGWAKGYIMLLEAGRWLPRASSKPFDQPPSIWQNTRQRSTQRSSHNCIMPGVSVG
jgi:geranylgeranyl reductase family protein